MAHALPYVKCCCWLTLYLLNTTVFIDGVVRCLFVPILIRWKNIPNLILVFLSLAPSSFSCSFFISKTTITKTTIIITINPQSSSLAKLAGLVIKTLSKPLSKRIKHEFSKSTTGTSLLEGMGQASHNITSRMTIWSAGYKVRNIQPLPSDKAIQMGSELVGESFVLFVSAGVIIYEYQRSKFKEIEKAEQASAKAAQERYELQQQLHAIHTRIEAMEQTISVLQQLPPVVPTNVNQHHETQPESQNENQNNNNLLQLLYSWWRK